MANEALMDELGKLEVEYREVRSRLAKVREQWQPEPFANYTFANADGGTTTLADLFGDKQDLLVVHNMGGECAYCTMWADGLNGLLPHLLDRAAIVVVSADSAKDQREFSRSRGWDLQMVSAAGTTFIEDAGYLQDDGPWPGVSAFRKNDDGSVVRVGRDYFGPGDVYNAGWNLFEMLDGGTGDWEPKLAY